MFDKGLVYVKEKRKRRKTEESKCNAVQLRDKKKKKRNSERLIASE